MLTISSSRRSIGLLFILSVSLAQGCRAYQRPSGSPSPGSRARVESSTPFAIAPSPGGGATGCQATSADGVVGSLTSEAITFSEIKGIDEVDWVGSACSRVSAGTVALRAGDEVKVRRFSLTRTAILLSSIVGLIALSIGQADVGF